jgi:uncharacterized membrane protein YhaH (DUF805 family)
MGSLLFSFKGRIGASELLKGSIIIIIVGVVFSLIPYFSLSYWGLGMLGIILIWPWLALFAKRFHDAGKSGWLSLLPLLASFILSFAVGKVLGKFIPVDTSAAEKIAETGDIVGAMTASVEATMPQLIPSTILGVIVSLVIVFLLNALIKSDPEENQFGAPIN